MSEPLPGSVTVAPDGQTYVYFGGVWGKAEGVTGGIEVDYNSLTIKPETSFNNAVNQIKNEDNANENNKWLTDQIKEYNVPVLENQNQVDQFLNGEKVDGFPQFDGSALEVSEDNKNNSGTGLKDIKRKRLSKYGRKKQGGVLRYPAELLTEHADYLQIDIERYEAIGSSYVNRSGGSDRYVTGNIVTNRAGRTANARLSRKPLINAGTILLPIPAQLQDSNNVVYGDSKLNGLAALGVSKVEEAMKGIGSKLAQQEGGFDLTAFNDDVQKGLQSGLGGDRSTSLNTAADLITKKLAAEAVNIFGANVTPNQLLARGNGEILNPNMELLFSDVTIRNFRFSFKLTPRNKREAEQVKLIIRAFKRNMAPQAQGGVANGSQFFLRTPNIFKLRYRSGNKDHPFLHKFKQCFLTDMQTTYTADGVYSTYEDGTPVSMQMDLSFKELQPIYDVDYDTKPGNRAVGY
jgi:hypothetical protein